MPSQGNPVPSPNEPHSSQLAAQATTLPSKQSYATMPKEGRTVVIKQALTLGFLGSLLSGTLLYFLNMNQNYLCSGLGSIICTIFGVPLVIWGIVMYCAVGPYSLKKMGLPNHISIVFTVLAAVLAFWIVLGGYVWPSFTRNIYLAVGILTLVFIISFFIVNDLFNHRRISHQARTILTAILIVIIVGGAGYKVFTFLTQLFQQAEQIRQEKQNKSFEDSKKINFQAYAPNVDIARKNVLHAVHWDNELVLYYTSGQGKYEFYESLYEGPLSSESGCPETSIFKQSECVAAGSLSSGEKVYESRLTHSKSDSSLTYFVIRGKTLIRLVRAYGTPSFDDPVRTLENMRVLETAELPILLRTK